MSSVKSVGLFPWCIYRDRQHVIDTRWFGDDSQVTSRLKQYEAIKVPLNIAVAMYWRVRKWRLTGFISATENAGTTQIPFDVISNPIITQEKNLVCRNQTTESNWESLNWETESFSGLVAGNLQESTFEFNFQFFTDAVPLQYNLSFKNGFCHFENWPPTQQKYVYVWTSILLTTESSDLVFTQISNFSFSAGNSEITVPVSLYDVETEQVQTFEMQVYSGVTDDPAPCELEITAEEYWPYDPNDGGGPIYDSSTGEQIRSFP